MANKQISQLPAASELQNNDLLVAEQNGVAKSVTGTVLLAMLDGHGGIASTSYTPPVAPSLQGTLTLTFADGTTASVPVYNGAQGATGSQGIQGEKGDPFTYEDFTPEQIESLRGPQGIQGATGNPGYCHIKWASVEPTSDADMSDTPDAWMGIYSGSSSTAPTAYTAYSWYEIKGDTGADGAPGARGSWIWQSNADVHGSGSNQYFYESEIYAPTPGTDAVVMRGDMVIYGDTYWFFTGEKDTTDNTKYFVGVGHSLNSAALPEYGQEGQVLKKLSDNSYDVGWAAPDVYYAIYGTTGFQNISNASDDGRVVILKRESNVGNEYTENTYYLQGLFKQFSLGDLPYLTRGIAVFAHTESDGTIYVATATWNFGSLDTTWTHTTVSPGGGSSDYTDLSNKPSINSVTLSGNKTAADLSLASAADVAAKYTKPSGGIPASDLASAVQTSLGKADTALQSVPSTYRTAAAQDTIDAGKEDKVTEVTVSTAGAVTQALDAGKIYHFTGALTALTITLNAAASGQIAHYHCDFDCGSTAPTVSIPNTVTMPDGNSFEANKHYEVDILNNFGAVLSWPNS